MIMRKSSAALLLCALSVFIHSSQAYLSCPSNYRLYGRKCYRSVKSSGKTWYQARSKCQQDGGVLAVMSTYQEALAVMTSMYKDIGFRIKSYDRLWIGLDDRGNEGKYKWTLADGSTKSLGSSDVNMYASGEGTRSKSGNGGKDCAQLERKLLWRHRSCSDTSTKGYICQVEPTGEWEEETGCTVSNSIQLDDKCMFILSESQNYFLAEHRCRATHKQADLARIHNYKDLFAAIALMDKIGLGKSEGAWFAPTDLFKSGFYVDMDGRTSDKYISSKHRLPSKSTNHAITTRTEWISKSYSNKDAKAILCSYDLVDTRMTKTLIASIMAKEHPSFNARDDLTDQPMSACKEACCEVEDINQCQAVTYNRESKECWQSDPDTPISNSDLDASTQGVFTFTRVEENAVKCPTEDDESLAFTELTGVEYQTNGETPISSSSMADKDECLNACKGDDTCGSATFYKDSTCLLMPFDYDRLSSNGQTPYMPSGLADVTYRKNYCLPCRSITCPPGYRLIDNYCYIIFAQSNTKRYDAISGCAKRTPGAQFGSFRSDTISDYADLWTDAGLNPNDEVWVSLSDAQANNNWRWMNGKSSSFSPNYKSYAVSTASQLVGKYGSTASAKGFLCETPSGA